MTPRRSYCLADKAEKWTKLGRMYHVPFYNMEMKYFVGNFRGVTTKLHQTKMLPMIAVLEKGTLALYQLQEWINSNLHSATQNEYYWNKYSKYFEGNEKPKRIFILLQYNQQAWHCKLRKNISQPLLSKK